MISFRKTISIVLFVLFSTGAMHSCTDKPNTAKAGEQQTPGQKQSSNLALGVPIPTLVYADDVKKYMRDLLAAPLPAGYVLPDEIRNTGDYGKSVAKVNERYPEFVNLESESLLRQVKAEPVRYQEMLLEARAVREFYFPGSQPKITK